MTTASTCWPADGTLRGYRENVYEGDDEEEYDEQHLSEMQDKADLESRQRHQMEEVYVRPFSHPLAERTMHSAPTVSI
jgi:hypothetical protein